MTARFLLAFLFLGLFSCEKAEQKPQKPNIVLILADDLGYGEVGFNGQKLIKTPNMDALAASGRIFTNHYTAAPVCAPARGMILTGLHSGHAYIRGNDEWRERGEVWDYAKAATDPNLEGQRPLPAETLTIAKVLQQNGYKTGIVGKWGLGAPLSEGIPTNLGFDYFFGYNCQRQAHNLYPPHLWENEAKVSLNNEIVVPGTKLDEGADPMDPTSYARYQQEEYAPEVMHEKALTFLEENSDQPFFLYYASPLPHLPLQAPQDLVEEYVEIFGEEAPYDGSKGYFPNRYPRATYAAMITLLDQQIGELRQKVEELGQTENTIFILTSDNGPTYTGGVDFDFFESSQPFSNGYGRTKGFIYEGGIRVPMVVNWPGKVQSGSYSDHISAFYDLFPTLCDLIGVDTPENLDGMSFLPAILGKEQKPHEFLYWEFPEYGGQQAVRMGKWKAVRQKLKEGIVKTELYDLSLDPLEENDLAESYPDIVAQLEEIMVKEHQESSIDRFKLEALGDQLNADSGS
ncbi:N-acetylgalactosamine-6-sulfatase [Algoriphagus kandeliae]|uniref:N-acetylgalactosamine-6-sulfatase n=1 Tax=Algoriphagus kandeliae TaxID=2562278 RepID=A0A4Y9QRX3_9BACT|nr:arylsulfatase [Algoriphagus kandeliae]TFV93675.1 N-acetylgalactosamine-6-sulfatase [Algoriphagus kandeliae]